MNSSLWSTELDPMLYIMGFGPLSDVKRAFEYGNPMFNV